MESDYGTMKYELDQTVCYLPALSVALEAAENPYSTEETSSNHMVFHC